MNERLPSECDELHAYVLERAADILVRLEEGDRIAFASAACRPMLGYEPRKLNGLRLGSLVHPEDRERFERDRQRSTPGAGRARATCRLLHEDGHYVWTETLFSAESHQNARRETIASVRDISERVPSLVDLRATVDAAEVADLREANRRMLLAEQIAHVGHWRLDLATFGLSWSDEIFHAYGLPKSEAPPLEEVLATYDREDRVRVLEALRTAVVTGMLPPKESRIRRPDGAHRYVLSSGRLERAADGTPVAIVGILQDVTERKLQELERERLVQRVRLAAAAGGVGIWDLDVATNELAVDARMHELFGLEKLSGNRPLSDWFAALHPADTADVVRAFQAAVRSGGSFDSEYRVGRPGSPIRLVHARGTFVTGLGTAGRLLGTCLDVTEIRTLAAQLREESAAAEKANRAKSDFLARMSHEIRTPMNGILGFATILLDGALAPDQRRYLLHLDAAAKSLLVIINDILDFSKIEAGRVELDRSAFSPVAVVDAALSIVRIGARAKGIDVGSTIGAGVPAWVWGDQTRVRQILLNLLSNAVKFTERGSVAVTVDSVGSAADDVLRFDVSDTGIGVPADQKHLLFREFSQLGGAHGRQPGGTGLGLAISRMLAEAMDGTLAMVANPAGGSTFRLIVALPPVEKPPDAFEDLWCADLPARRILVAEDNPVNRVVIDTLLKRDGHTVVLVANGAEAVVAVQARRFDAVLMDMEMPVMKGAEATRRIRALGDRFETLPIIALTANALPEQIKECRSAGMNDHLAKPIDRQRLRETLSTWAGNDALPAQGDGPDQAEPPALATAMLLELFDGDRAAVAELFAAARASIEADALRIERGTAENDAAAIAEAAHRLKGTSGSIAALRLTAVSSSLEGAARNKHLPAVVSLLPELGTAVAETAAAIACFVMSDRLGEHAPS